LIYLTENLAAVLHIVYIPVKHFSSRKSAVTIGVLFLGT